MTRQQEAVRTMYIAVRDYLVANTAIWTASAGMTAAVTKLSNHIDLILSHSIKQGTDTKGVTTTKGEKRTNLVNNIVKVAGSIESFATATGDSTLAGQVKVRSSYLLKMPDTDLKDEGHRIRTLGNTHVVALADYNVLPADITALQTATAAFVAEIPKPKNTIGFRRGGTIQLENEFKATNIHLLFVLDPLVRTYNSTDHEFVLVYFNTREIYNNAKLKRALNINVDESGSHMSLANVMVVINPGNLTKKTSATGQVRVQHLDPGTYTATFSKNGYTTQEEVFYINNGETTQVVVSMVAV